MAYRDIKQITGIGNPAASLAVEGDIVKQLIEAEKVSPDLLSKFISRQKDRDTDRLLGEMQRVNTGNPLLDEQKRQEIYTARGLGLFDQGEINTAMPLMEVAGHEQYEQDVSTRDRLLSESHKAIERKQIFDIGQYTPGTSEYEQKVSEIQQYNFQNKITAPASAKAYAGLVDRENFVLSPNTIIQGVGAESLGEDGSILVKENFTPDNYEKTIQIAEGNIRKRFPFLRDETVIRSKAKAMVDNSKYGPEFARQAGFSLEDREINTLASKLSTAITSGNSEAKFKAANAMMSYMRANKVSPENKTRFDADIMQVVKTMDIEPGSGKMGGFDEARGLFYKLFKDIEKEDKEGHKYTVTAQQQGDRLLDRGVPVGIQTRYKDLLRHLYRTRLPGLTDDILEQQMGNIYNNDSDLSIGFSEGQATAAGKAKRRADQRKAILEEQDKQVRLLIRMNKSANRGVKNVVSNDLMEKWRDRGYLGVGDHATETKLIRQVDLITDRLDSFFRKKDGTSLLSTAGMNAYKLTVRRMLMNNVGLDKDRFWSWFGDKDDIILTRPTTDMSGDDFNKIMELFRKNMPDPKYSVQSTNKTGFKIKDGAANLIQAIELKKEQASKIKGNLFSHPSFFATKNTWAEVPMKWISSVFLNPKDLQPAGLP